MSGSRAVGPLPGLGGISDAVEQFPKSDLVRGAVVEGLEQGGPSCPGPAPPSSHTSGVETVPAAASKTTVIFALCVIPDPPPKSSCPHNGPSLGRA